MKKLIAYFLNKNRRNRCKVSKRNTMHPCPFCDSTALTLTDLSGSLLGANIAFISCRNCKAMGPTKTNAHTAWEGWYNREKEPEKIISPLCGELNSCIFCKSKNVKIVSSQMGYFVECRGCKASGPLQDTPAEAGTKWNKQT